MRRIKWAALGLALLLALSGISALAGARPELLVGFEFTRLDGRSTNQFALWIEDAQGNLVKTLCATGFAAQGGYENRPEAIKRWVEKAKPQEMEKEQLDAVTSATPETGRLSYSWDLTGADGQPAPGGDYRICLEGTLRDTEQVLYEGTVQIGGEAQAVVMEPTYFGDKETDRGMIAGVTASYTP